MNFLPLIEAKRDGKKLTGAQIRAMVEGYRDSSIPDYQMAAMLMAIYFRGMDLDETAALTAAMKGSGQSLSFPEDPRPIVDKHSTGGVGDKVSLPLAPLLACLGFRVPMISGRGLGITGGTLDKLESIPGFSTALPIERIQEQTQSLGVALCGQTKELAPADRLMYALRDVTGTVPSIPLITASILCKKLSESLDALILDVKFGSAAPMATLDKARDLALRMVEMGKNSGVSVRAMLTDMNVPLGRTAGNWLEIRESVDCLEGRGPDDLRALVLECAAHLLVQTGRSPSLDCARETAADTLDSGAPRRKWDEILVAQGADLDAFQRKLALDHTAPVVRDVPAPRAGFIAACDARTVGKVVHALGGGRSHKEAKVDPEVGVDRLLKPGEKVDAGQSLVRIHARTQTQAESAAHRIAPTFIIKDEPPAIAPLIREVIG